MIFDSTEIINLERNAGVLRELAASAGDDPFGISIITVSELLHGIERAKTDAVRLRRKAFVESVFEHFPVFLFDMSAARMHAKIWAHLEQKGEMIGAHDLIIAATAVALGYEVVTSNLRDFQKVPGLKARALA
jgi:predicted nucleic acid-binding protein